MTAWDDITEFNDKNFSDWRKRDPLYYSNAILGELGEMANALKHAIGGGTHKEKTPDQYIGDVQEELADVYIYLVLMCERMGMDHNTFEAVVKAKIGVCERRMNCHNCINDGQPSNLGPCPDCFTNGYYKFEPKPSERVKADCGGDALPQDRGDAPARSSALETRRANEEFGRLLWSQMEQRASSNHNQGFDPTEYKKFAKVLWALMGWEADEKCPRNGEPCVVECDAQHEGYCVFDELEFQERPDCNGTDKRKT